jgi:hypothetical protein
MSGSGSGIKESGYETLEQMTRLFFTEILFELPVLRSKCAENNVLTPCIAQKKNSRITRKGGGGGGGSVRHPWVL